MQMPLNYKDLREELDEILLELEVPRELYHRLADLVVHLQISFPVIEPKSTRALEIIDLIMPSPIQR